MTVLFRCFLLLLEFSLWFIGVFVLFGLFFFNLKSILSLGEEQACLLDQEEEAVLEKNEQSFD